MPLYIRTSKMASRTGHTLKFFARRRSDAKFYKHSTDTFDSTTYTAGDHDFTATELSSPLAGIWTGTLDGARPNLDGQIDVFAKDTSDSDAIVQIGEAYVEAGNEATGAVADIVDGVALASPADYEGETGSVIHGTLIGLAAQTRYAVRNESTDELDVKKANGDPWYSVTLVIATEPLLPVKGVGPLG